MGPAALATVSDVVHDQRTFVHTSRNLGGGIVVALATGRVGLDVRVGVHLQHVVLVVVGPNRVAVLLAVLHVPMAVQVVAVLVVRHKEHSVSPRPVHAAPVGIQARFRVATCLCKPEVRRHLPDHGQGRIQVRRRDAAHPKLQNVQRRGSLAFPGQGEIVVRDVARRRLQRLRRVESNDSVARSLHVAIFKRRIPHQEEVFRGIHLTLTCFSPIAKHHHEHFDGRRVSRPGTEGVKDVLLLDHCHALPKRCVKGRQRVCGWPQCRHRHHDVVHLTEAVNVAVSRVAQGDRTLRSIPAERSVALGLPALNVSPHGATRFGENRHALDLQRVCDVPNFVWRRTAHHVFRTRHDAASGVDRKAVDGRLA